MLTIMFTIICIEIITELTETMLIFIMAYTKVGELEEWVLHQDGIPDLHLQLIYEKGIKDIDQLSFSSLHSVYFLLFLLIGDYTRYSRMTDLICAARCALPCWVGVVVFVCSFLIKKDSRY